MDSDALGVVRKMLEVESVGIESGIAQATKLNKMATVSKIVRADFAKSLIDFFINTTFP